MPTISHKEMENILRYSYASHTSVYIHGTVGIGKSTTMKEVAKMLARYEKREFIEWDETLTEKKMSLMKDPANAFIYADVRLSSTESVDMRGILNIQSSSKAVDWVPTLLFATLGHPKAKGLLFFDEMNLADPSVLNAAYQIINDRQVGEYPLNKDVMVTAAGNRSEDKVAVFELGSALRNRFVHFDLRVPSVEEWSMWASKTNVMDPRIIGYLRANPKNLFTLNENTDANSFATPRSWEFASKYVRMFKDLKNPDQLHQMQLLVQGCVGDGVGATFASYVKMSDQLDIDAVLEKPELAKEITDVEKRWALITGIAEKYRTTPLKKFNIDGAFQVVGMFDPDFGMLMLRLMQRARGVQAFKGLALKSPAYTKFVERHPKVLSMALGM